MKIEKNANIGETESESSKHPRAKANILSQIFFWWVVPIIKLGNRRSLREKDLYKVVPEDESAGLGRALHKEWLIEVTKCGNNTKKNRPSLARAIRCMFGRRYILLGLQAFVEECIIKVGQPVCLGQLISYFNSDTTITTEYAYVYATGVVLGSVYNTLSNHSLCFNSQHIGMQARVAASSLIYQKSLKLSQKALCQTTIGQMLNLISNDVNRFDQLFIYLYYLWVGPLQIIFTTIVLYYNIGLASLVGLVVLFILVPLHRGIGYFFSVLRKKVAGLTDERIRIVNEMIPAMRVIKMYAWEKPFQKITELARRLEVAVIRQTGYLRAFNVTLLYVSSKLMIFPTLVAFVLLGNELTPEKVFLIVALFNNTRVAMPGHFSAATQMAAEASVSIRRIEDFLLLNEMVNNGETPEKRPTLVSQRSNIEFSKVTVKWPVASAEFDETTLSGISFRARPGQCLAVIGQVGSGKTTLLNAILGELPVLSGSSVVDGRIAYASQEYWIITGSIRQNILCGAELDPERYHRVIQAAALEQDFARLPQGDSSIIGEGGVSLSGGQKARVNLARALYIDADIYLLDDPLSAVDTKVGSHLFQKAINGFLKGKIRVLVTHQLQYLKDVDQIIVLKAGRIEFTGTYRELQKKGMDVNKLIKEGDDDEEEDEEEEPVFNWPTSSKPLDPIQEDEVPTSWSSAERLSSVRRQSIAKYARRQSKKTRTSTTVSSLRIKSIRESNRIKARRSLMTKVEAEPQTIKEEEEPIISGVSAGTYLKYLKSGGGICSIVLFIISCLVTEAIFCASDYWLNMWTEAEKVRFGFNEATENYFDVEGGNYTFPSNDTWVMDTSTGIYVYSALIASVFMFGFMRAVQFFVICTAVSVKLYDNMFNAVIRAPISFFDKNPVGRIVNRFTKDTGCMDDQLPSVFFDPIYIALNTLGAIVMVSVVKYWLILPALVLGVVFYLIRRVYLKAAAGIKRLETNTKSPVFTQLYSSLIGITTLRAHKCQAAFQQDFDRFQDIHSSAWVLFMGTARWLGFWMDWIVTTYIASVTYACVAFRGSMSSGEAGLIISAALSMARFQFGIRQSAEMENQMSSVARIIEYGKLKSEAAFESSKAFKPPRDWPSSGIIQFEDTCLSYNPNDPPVLKNLSLTINSCEKIGIVGRSGAGKSTIVAALFRLSEPDGRVLIDGFDPKQFGLHDLRSNLAIIPQEPIMFSGSLRSNLDPFEKIGDDKLWAAIKDVHLDTFIDSGSTGNGLLDFVISEGGTNLSVGQRQLICLARAILRNNKILVLDEATASVDKETDVFIQLIIREKFRDCTVLTIAHRLNTIIDSDRILVLDAGRLSEYDEPIKLLLNTTGIFYSLVEQTGPQEAAELSNMAKQASEFRHTLETLEEETNNEGIEDDSNANITTTKL